MAITDERLKEMAQGCQDACYADIAAALRELLALREQNRSEGVKLIAAERERQVSVEGWTPEHDDEHSDQSLIDAALVYADFAGASQRGATIKGIREIYLDVMETITWPWAPTWLKLSPDPIRNLVKAGALIAAEIDRLSRAATEKGDGG